MQWIAKTQDQRPGGKDAAPRQPSAWAPERRISPGRNAKPPLRWRSLPTHKRLPDRPYIVLVDKFAGIATAHEAIHQLDVTMAAYIAENDNDMMKFCKISIQWRYTWMMLSN